ncbi:glycosyltransferase [Gammaproteobacteria bacterium]|nr:glycosyltransferase [Gammaproteobacteria bacterium]
MKGRRKDKVSVIMPVYNAGELLNCSVRSALGQTHQNIEVIVVDDGSSDDSAEVAQALGSADTRVQVVSQPNQGPGVARNKGLYLATGDFVTFLDADDYWADGCIEKLLAPLEGSGAAIAYCGWQNVGLSGGKGEPFVPPDYSTGDVVETFLRSCPWPIHAALSCREVVVDAGGFDEQLTSCMDYDLWLRLATQHPIVRVPEVLAFYVHHEAEQITKNRLRGALNHWQVQKKFIQSHPEVLKRLGRRKIRDLTYGALLQRAYQSYWDRELHVAHPLFRTVMKGGYGRISEWKYMLPALLPEAVYKSLLSRIDQRRE